MAHTNRGTTMNYTLITGACGGLGRAFVAQTAAGGKNLILIGTNKERLETLKKDTLAAHSNIFIETFVCDQSKTEQRQKLFENISTLNVDTAILNAGYIDEGPIETKTDFEIEGVIRTNCEGTIIIAKNLFEKAIKENTPLSLLVTSSLSAFYPMPNMAIYAASKSMLLNFFLAMREEMKTHGISITVLCPGGIPTTQAMKDAIKAQGLGGKLSSLSAEKTAAKALRALRRKKAYVIPGGFNKFLKWAGTSVPRTFTAKQIGKRWAKSQSKRK